MDQEWEHDGCPSIVYVYEKGLCASDSCRWGIYRWSRSIRTETFVAGSWPYGLGRLSSFLCAFHAAISTNKSGSCQDTVREKRERG